MVIETSSPAHIDEDKRYNDIVKSMHKALDDQRKDIAELLPRSMVSSQIVKKKNDDEQLSVA